VTSIIKIKKIVNDIMKKLRIGLIGGGYWGKNYLRLLNEMQCFLFTSFVDSNENTLIEANKKYPQIFTSTNPQDIIDKVDCVVIATPVPTHYVLGKMFIEHMKHVLIEKPLAESTENAIKLIELSKKFGVILMVGYTVLYTSGIKYLKDYLVKTNAKIFYMMTNRGNLGIIRKDCDVVYDLMCHDLAIIFYLLENYNVNDLNSLANSYVSTYMNDVNFSLMTINDVIVNSYISWLDSNKSRNIDIVTDNYKIIYDDTNQFEPIKIFNKSLKNKDGNILKDDTNIVIPTIQWTEPLRNQCQHFYDCILSNTEPISGGNFVIQINKLLEMISPTKKHIDCTKTTCLVTCVGSAPARAVINGLKPEYNVIGIDMQDYCAGKYTCDEYIKCPSINDEKYFDFIEKMINEKSIKYIYVIHDVELLKWSQKKEYLEKKHDIKIFINDENFINITTDKLKMNMFCEMNDINIPKIYKNEKDVEFPAIIKTKKGSGSVGMVICKNKDDLDMYKNNNNISDVCNNDNIFVQEFVTGIEYTCDVLSDKNFKVLSVVPKKRIEIRGGAAFKSITIKNDKIINFVKDLSEKIKNKYSVNVQVIENEKGLYFIELNAKWATSLPLTIEAGINMPQLLIDINNDKIVSDLNFKNNLMMVRHFTEYYEQL